MVQRENNFWKGLKKPIIGLAPMDGVTDAAMRYITKKYGNPDVMFTEFTNVEGISHAIRSHKWSPSHRLARNFKYDESQRPIVAQLFGKDPGSFRLAAKLMVELGFDGVDINMGCPAKNVSEHGSGAALIGQPDLAGEIISAVQQGVSESASQRGISEIPVSVKTRMGIDQVVTEKWIEHLLQFDLAAITLHGRTLKQMYQGLADWEEIGKAAKLIKESKKEIIFLGNGDLKDIADCRLHIAEYGCDGVLIGRAAMGAPWVFDPKFKEKSIKEKVEMMIEHSRKYEEFFPGEAFMPMRKHLAWYAKGFDGASELRQKLVMTNSAEEVEQILQRL